MKQTLFFETFSPFQVIALYFKIRKATRIYFNRKIYPRTLRERIFAKSETITRRLISVFNKSVEIGTLPEEFLLKNNWEMNRKAADFVQKQGPQLERDKLYKLVSRIINNHRVIQFYQHEIVSDVAARLMFIKGCHYLKTNLPEGEGLEVIPIDEAVNVFEAVLFPEDQWIGKNIQKIVRNTNRIRNWFLRSVFCAALIVIPCIFLVQRVKNIRFKQKRVKFYKVLMPCIYGVFEKEQITEGIRRSQTDEYLYNKNLKSGEIIHLFGKWGIDPKAEKEYKSTMNKKGLSYTDYRRFEISFAFLKECIKIQGKLLAGMIAFLFSAPATQTFVPLLSIKGLFFFLSKRLEIENINYAVEIISDDYNATHILATIINRQVGRKTIALQHHINMYDFPQLCFSEVDQYIVFSKLVVDTYQPHWDRLQLEKTGRLNIDWVAGINSNQDYKLSLRNRLNRLYGKPKFVIMFTLPTGSLLNRISQWDEVYKACLELKNSKLDFVFFLRFRSADHVENITHLKRFKHLPDMDQRFVIDHINFTTHELMVLSDLVICNSVSFSIFESIAIQRKTFSFDFIGVAPYYFPDYGTDFILNSSSDLVRAVKGLEHNFEGFDCNWSKLQEECNYHADGRNLERIHDVVNKTVQGLNHRSTTINEQ